jgi:hypothetical protein
MDDVVGIHEDSIDTSLEATVMRPQSGYYPDAMSEAAALWDSLP